MFRNEVGSKYSFRLLENMSFWLQRLSDHALLRWDYFQKKSTQPLKSDSLRAHFLSKHFRPSKVRLNNEKCWPRGIHKLELWICKTSIASGSKLAKAVWRVQTIYFFSVIIILKSSTLPRTILPLNVKKGLFRYLAW